MKMDSSDSGEPAQSPRRDFETDVRPELVLEDKQDRDALVQLLRRPSLYTVRDCPCSPRPPSSAASAADGAEVPTGPPWEGQGGVDDSTGTAGSDLNAPLEKTGTNVT